MWRSKRRTRPSEASSAFASRLCRDVVVICPFVLDGNGTVSGLISDDGNGLKLNSHNNKPTYRKPKHYLTCTQQKTSRAHSHCHELCWSCQNLCFRRIYNILNPHSGPRQTISRRRTAAGKFQPPALELYITRECNNGRCLRLPRSSWM